MSKLPTKLRASLHRNIFTKWWSINKFKFFANFRLFKSIVEDDELTLTWYFGGIVSCAENCSIYVYLSSNCEGYCKSGCKRCAIALVCPRTYHIINTHVVCYTPFTFSFSSFSSSCDLLNTFIHCYSHTVYETLQVFVLFV